MTIHSYPHSKITTDQTIIFLNFYFLYEIITHRWMQYKQHSSITSQIGSQMNPVIKLINFNKESLYLSDIGTIFIQ